MTDHPITPSPELVRQWAEMLASGSGQAVFAMAAQWGADQELEACCKVLEYQFMADSIHLRAARRPKPPSLKEQALEAQQRLMTGVWRAEDWQLIRRALEALDD
jgi:hypothetical protein